MTEPPPQDPAPDDEPRRQQPPPYEGSYGDQEQPPAPQSHQPGQGGQPDHGQQPAPGQQREQGQQGQQGPQGPQGPQPEQPEQPGYGAQQPGYGQQQAGREWQEPGAGQPAYGGQQPAYSGQQPGPGGQQPTYGEQAPYGGQQPGYPGYGGQAPYGGGYPSYPGYPGGQGGYMDPGAGLASRWARLGAGIIDALLVGIVTAIIAVPFVDWDRVFDADDGSTYVVPTGQWTANIIGIVLSFLYYWLMTARWGQTLGKKALGIRVVRQEDGGAVSNGQAAGREAFYTVVGGICGCIGLINIVWILFDRRKQALHDKIAKTVVVPVDRGAPDPYAMR